jgi:hypothetical protein
MSLDLQSLIDTFGVTALAVAGAVVLALVVALVWLLVRRRRRAQEPAVTGGTAPELTNDFDERALSPEARTRLEARWEGLQRDFVDTPAGALQRAHVLLVEALRERGYPATGGEALGRLLDERMPAHSLTWRQLRQSLTSDGDRDLPTEAKRQLLLQARTMFDAVVATEEQRRRRDLFAA